MTDEQVAQSRRAFAPVDDFTVKFADLNDADKIERLRRELSAWIGAVDRLRTEVDRLKAHQHLDGKLVLPIDHDRNAGACGTWNKLS